MQLPGRMLGASPSRTPVPYARRHCRQRTGGSVPVVCVPVPRRRRACQLIPPRAGAYPVEGRDRRAWPPNVTSEDRGHCHESAVQGAMQAPPALSQATPTGEAGTRGAVGARRSPSAANPGTAARAVHALQQARAPHRHTTREARGPSAEEARTHPTTGTGSQGGPCVCSSARCIPQCAHLRSIHQRASFSPCCSGGGCVAG
jgi:hypothetical protein